MSISQDILDEIALSRSEYELIIDKIDRDPNGVELGLFGALWSEHCGYKHSKPLLGLLPSKSARVLSKTGAENAGAIDIGNGMAIVFKVESHNHPSAVEPLQGAATGVGGIVRDILAMGARPIALLNSLRFGDLNQPNNQHLFNGVVNGISWYGNCIGVPDVAGEIYFDKSYTQNPLVNAMCVGLVAINNIATSDAGAPGNTLLLVGSGTGRDGIHGASGLASRTFDEEQELRPTVQVGNPFLEKVLIEACLEALETGKVAGIQDLGAAGLTSAAIESVSKSGNGLILDVSKVHRRETGMSAYEVMLSESQERMLLSIPNQYVPDIQSIMDKWDVQSSIIGTVTDEPRAHIYDSEEMVANLPIKELSDAPKYRLKGEQSSDQIKRQKISLSDANPKNLDPTEVLFKLISSQNISSRQSVYRQYDHQVQTNTVVGPGDSDAAVIRIKGTGNAIALTIDGNGRYCYLDPFRGGQIVVAEACRNLSCTGAEPLALTDCLNFGDPERPDIYFQLEQAIKGMAKACRSLGVPIVSGNVSLYNESQGQPIYPTPIIGGLGLLPDPTYAMKSGFIQEGEKVFLVGSNSLRPRLSDLAGSEYLHLIHNKVVGRPTIDIGLEKALQSFCRKAISDRLLSSCHDCSDGGLAIAISESAMQNQIGFIANSTLSAPSARWDTILFGERQSRVIISISPENEKELLATANTLGVPLSEIGTTGGDFITLGNNLSVSLQELTDSWSNALEQL